MPALIMISPPRTLPRTTSRLEDVAGAVRGVRSEPAGSENSSGGDVAAKATEQLPLKLRAEISGELDVSSDRR
jgi:hypothetical protein